MLVLLAASLVTPVLLNQEPLEATWTHVPVTLPTGNGANLLGGASAVKRSQRKSVRAWVRTP